MTASGQFKASQLIDVTSIYCSPWTEVNAEDDQPQDDKGGLSFANTIEEKGEDSPPPQTIEINILPVSSDEFSCKGVPNGNQVDPNPTNCLSFYTCVDEVAYKIMCPQIPFKTYYNPVQKTCGDVDETFCLTFAGDSEKISSEKSDLTPDEEQDTIDQTNFGGEIFDELIHDRVEL